MNRRKAAREMFDALMEECGPEKTDDQLTVESWIWRQLGEPVLASIVLEARDAVKV